MKININEKTVFVLGAGFSIEANAPTQYGLIKEIFKLQSKVPSVFKNGSFKDFEDFLNDVLYINEDRRENVELEDIFTPLDRCISENTSFRGLSHDQMKQVRNNLYYLLAITLQELLKNGSPEYIDNFARYLVKLSKTRSGGNYKNTDPVSVISLNWDILLDNSIKRELDISCFDEKGVVDYCCYISSFNRDDDTIKPGLEALGSGGFNVKLLKMHGSLNWLSCPRCYRLYIGFYEKIGLFEYYNQQTCRHCKNNYSKESVDSKLVSSLIMPTFIKDLNSPQLKVIWQNAAVELSEATKVVFIGYSLPSADFEYRQLLSRMVRRDADIIVVDFDKDQDVNNSQVAQRYLNFFGKRKITFFLKGAKDFILNELTHL